MTSLKEFNNRHKAASRLLADTAKKKTDLYGVVKCSEKVAAVLDISAQTVRNYLDGRGKDGFLMEAIIKEFQELTFD